MLFFTSDIHFDDGDTLINDNRPFKSTKSFDRCFIKMMNKQAKKGDTIYVIGDFIDCNGDGHDSWKKSILYIKKIKADVILIMGNNEDRVVKYYFDNDFNEFRDYCLSIGFKDVCKNLVVRFNHKEFYLVHKPIHYNPNILLFYYTADQIPKF